MSRVTFVDALAIAFVTLTMRDAWRLMDKASVVLPGWWHYPINLAISAAFVAWSALVWRMVVGKDRWS